MPLTGNTIWIDKVDRLEIDGDGVRICLRSDDSCIKMRMSRHVLRKFVMQAKMELDAQDAIDRNKVIGMRAKRD